jgi:pyridoxal 5'-phosphate synthase pdxT subunit
MPEHFPSATLSTPATGPLLLGVLALQGDFREHRQVLTGLGAVVREVRLPSDLIGLSGLIIPGGESTTIGKLMTHYGLIAALREFSGAIWGTCAGAIMLSREIVGSVQPSLGVMDIRVARNAFGRQVDSFEQDLAVTGLETPFRAVFIRAPVIVEVGAGVEVLCRVNDQVVLARQGRYLAASFHPELTGDARLHAMFMQMAQANADSAANNA